MEGAELALRLAGDAGASASREGQRRHDRRQAELLTRVGRLAGVVDLLTDDPQSTRSWVVGGGNETRVGRFLERELSGVAILLHDRRIPGSPANIDHVAIASSGVWVIDSKAYSGRVRSETAGPIWNTQRRLTVADRDRTKLLEKMHPQSRAVELALADDSISVRSVLCFNGADWGLLGRSFTIDDVLVTFPGALVEAVRQAGELDLSAVGRLASRIAQELPPAK